MYKEFQSGKNLKEIIFIASFQFQLNHNVESFPEDFKLLMGLFVGQSSISCFFFSITRLIAFCQRRIAWARALRRSCYNNEFLFNKEQNLEISVDKWWNSDGEKRAESTNTGGHKYMNTHSPGDGCVATRQQALQIWAISLRRTEICHIVCFQAVVSVILQSTATVALLDRGQPIWQFCVALEKPKEGLSQWRWRLSTLLNNVENIQETDS